MRMPRVEWSLELPVSGSCLGVISEQVGVVVWYKLYHNRTTEGKNIRNLSSVLSFPPTTSRMKASSRTKSGQI